MEKIGEILLAVFSAAIYALAGYLKSNESFDIVKAVSTLITGAIVGTILSFMGVKVTEENVATQMITMAGLLYFVEGVIKGIARKFRKVQ